MTAVFKDLNGIKRNFLWQYDKGQTLILESLDYEVSPEVHFETSSSTETLVSTGSFDNGIFKVSIPDALLLEARKITAYLYVGGAKTSETVKVIDINVRPRKKPSDYIYTDDMYVISVESINDGITDYISANIELIEDVVVNYTTVHLIDDSNGKEYVVGINNSKLYIKEVE